MRENFTAEGGNMPNYQPFIGFTYNGEHSIEDLHIYRTSNSNRYDENLTATMTDKTVDVPGGDGQYYFGTTFKNRTFTVNYAFDNLKKSDIAKMKRVFSGDGIHELVFDEDRDADGKALKIWSAKVTGTATMKHLCFEEGGEDIYKGEGSITFTCYYPYAHSEKIELPSKNWGSLNTNNGDLPAPFIGQIRRWKNTDIGFKEAYEIESNTKIYGICYSDGKSSNYVYFTQSREIGDGEYNWNTKLGLITYISADGKIQILGVQGNEILNIPVGSPIGRLYFIMDPYQKDVSPEVKWSKLNTEKSSFYEYYR